MTWTLHAPISGRAVPPAVACRSNLWPVIPTNCVYVEVSDAGEPDAPEWWGATLYNVTTGEEHPIGYLQVPGSWELARKSCRRIYRTLRSDARLLRYDSANVEHIRCDQG